MNTAYAYPPQPSPQPQNKEDNNMYMLPPLPELTSLAYVLAPTSTSLVKIKSAVLSTWSSTLFLPRLDGLSLRLHYRWN